MNVLITGGGGFAGSHLVESQLIQGHRVRCVDLRMDRLAHMASHPALELIVGSITNTDLLAKLLSGIDVVYHLASLHLELNVPEASYWEVNVEATRNLLKSAHAVGAKRFVHCGSVGVYGQIANPPADEATSCHPTNIYEKSKLAGEKAALELSREVGQPIVVVRPAWIYGPRCPRTTKLFRAIERGRFIMIGQGKALRQPIYVEDFVAGLELCADSRDSIGRTYVLAGAERVTIEALTEMIAQVIRVSPPHLRIPTLLAKVGGITLQTACKPFGVQPPFSLRTLDFFLKTGSFDISKAQRELGFRPRVNLKEGLMKTWEWLRNQSRENQN